MRLRILALTAGAAALLAACDTADSPDGADGLTTYDKGGGEASASQPPDHAGRRFNLTMTGDAEVPGPGDPDGTGTALLSFNPGQQRVCYDIDVMDVDSLTAAHVHVGVDSVAGPPVIPLPVGDPKPTHITGCVEDVDRSLITDIFRNPAGYYVNVHNDAFPAGALRAQLRRGN